MQVSRTQTWRASKTDNKLCSVELTPEGTPLKRSVDVHPYTMTIEEAAEMRQALREALALFPQTIPINSPSNN